MLDRMGSALAAKGRYSARIIRDGEVIDEFDCENLIVNQGLDYIGGVALTGVQQQQAWFLALFSANYQPVPSDTAATIVNSATENTSYQGGVRPSFNGVEGGQQVTNASNPATFTMTASATIYGAFLTSSQQQGSGQGVLFSALQFAQPKTLAAGDILVLTYALAVGSQ